MQKFKAQEIRQSELAAEITEDGVLLRFGDVIAGLGLEEARGLCGWLVNAVGYYTEANPDATKEITSETSSPADDTADTSDEPDTGDALPETLH